MDAHAPVAAEGCLDAAAAEPAGESEAALPVADGAPSSVPASAARRPRTYLPRPARRALQMAGRWTHTPLALWLGTGATALLTAVVVGGVVLVGIRGVSAPNTHYYYPNVAELDSPVNDTLIFPRPQAEVGPPSIELAIPGTLSASAATLPHVSYDQLSAAVLQDYDLDSVFSLEGAAPVGEDPRNGLIAIYDASYQRGGSSIDQSLVFPGLKAVFSDVALYTDASTASAQMATVDVTQLGLNAGLPDMTATPLSLPRIGDESRAVRLIGTAGGTLVEVVLIQFRVNGAVGVVGVAAALDDDPALDTQAVALAQTQQRNMLGLTPSQP